MEEEPPVNGPLTPILMVSSDQARPAVAMRAARTVNLKMGFMSFLPWFFLQNTLMLFVNFDDTSLRSIVMQMAWV
jgi:hypothetical protein